MKQMAALSLVLPVLACSPAPTAGDPGAEAASPGPYAFDVQLTLTPRAAGKLVSTRERIIVAGMFWGAPSGAAKPAADEMGQIPLGEDFVEVAPENATVTVPAASFDPAQLPKVEGAPQVLVNVYSARKTHDDNLLSCGIYEGPVAMAQKQPVDIQCDLIYDENGEPLPSAPSPT